MFNALSLVCNLATYVEQGDVSKPALVLLGHVTCPFAAAVFLCRYVPVLRWLLRDFVLELVDEAGEPMSPDQRGP